LPGWSFLCIRVISLFFFSLPFPRGPILHCAFFSPPPVGCHAISRPHFSFAAPPHPPPHPTLMRLPNCFCFRVPCCGFHRSPYLGLPPFLVFINRVDLLLNPPPLFNNRVWEYELPNYFPSLPVFGLFLAFSTEIP